MRKVLFLTTRYPYPTDSGRKLRLSQLIKASSNKYKTVLVYFGEENEKKEGNNLQAQYCINVPRIFERLSNFVWYSLILRKKSIQESIYYSKKINEQIKEIIKKEKPDLVVVDMLRTAQYVEDLHEQKKILDLDDLMSVRYQRFLEILNKPNNDIHIDIAGQYGSNLPKLLKKFIEWKWVSQSILRFESNLIKKREMQVSEIFNEVLLVSEIETKHLRQTTGAKNIHGIPLCINVEEFENYSDVNKLTNVLTFLGVLNVPHNKYAIMYFLKVIFPKILSERSSVKLRIIGRNADSELESLTQQFGESVELTGYVKDIKETLASSTIFIAPLKFGTGIKTKILEAMALHLPVITTSVGVEGIPAMNNKELVIADSEVDFANAIIELLDNNTQRESLGTNASKFIKEHFAEEVVLDRFIGILEETMTLQIKGGKRNV